MGWTYEFDFTKTLAVNGWNTGGVYSPANPLEIKRNDTITTKTGIYSYSDSTGFTFEFSLQLINRGDNNSIEISSHPYSVISIGIYAGYIKVWGGSSIYVDTSVYHLYRFTVLNGTVTCYVDGTQKAQRIGIGITETALYFGMDSGMNYANVNGINWFNQGAYPGTLPNLYACNAAGDVWRQTIGGIDSVGFK